MAVRCGLLGVLTAATCNGAPRVDAVAAEAGFAPLSSPRLMAVLPAGTVAGITEELQVLENLQDAGSPIIFQGISRRFEITKSGERVIPKNETALWAGNGEKAVMTDDGDVLGNEILTRGRDPNYSEIAALLPPVLATNTHCGDFALDGQSFVGSRIAAEKRSFSPMGVDAWANTRQQYHFDVERLSLNNTRAGLLGGFLPALRWHWPLSTGDYVEQLTFAVPESTEDAPFDVSSQQPVWFRYLNVTANGTLRYAHYVDTYEDYPIYCQNASSSSVGGRESGWHPSQLECDGEHAVDFYTALLRFALFWNATWTSEGAMEIEVPSHGIDVANFAKHSVVREMITRRDLYHPRYGVPPNAYGSHQVDGFQDVFVMGLATYLEWGLLKAAAGVFDNYFTFYTRRRARVMYRGPELAQFSRMLTLAAQFYRQTGDPILLLKHAQKLVDISDMLMARRRAAKQLPPSDPSYGMLRGQDESDEILVGWTKNTTELPHFSFSLEAWRGFRDLGAVWSELGATHSRSDLTAVGAALEKEAPLILEDVNTAMARSIVRGDPSGAAPCHPYVAGEETCADMRTAGAHVSGTSAPYNARANEPWRTYSGMLWSGGVSAQVVTDIVNYNQNNAKLSRLGIWGGGNDFENRLVSFTEQGHGFGLIQHNLVEPFLLQLYAEMAHACSRGSWTCFETRGLPNWTPAGGYSTPSQVVVPLHVRWMLVFVDPMNHIVTLCKATPRSWLEPGERIAVRNVPLGLRRLSFTVSSHLGDASPMVVANISLTASGGAASLPAAPALWITFRVPVGYVLSGAMVDGAPLPPSGLAVEKESVNLPSLTARTHLSLVAAFRKSDDIAYI